jgi:hypothetical protein
MDTEYNSMPAVGGDAPESEEERKQRLIRMAGGMSGNGMPPVAAPTPPPVKAPSVDLGDPIGNKGTMPAAMTEAPPEMRANASAGSAMPPAFFGGAEEHPHASAGPGMPPAFYAGNSEQPRTPSPVQANSMPAVGPQTQKLLDMQEQARPGSEGHPLPWWKRALDIASQVHPIGRMIERNIPGSPGNYDVELARQAMKSTRERGIEKEQVDVAGERARQRRDAAPQHVGQFTSDEGQETEVSRNPESGAYSTQGVGEVGGKEKPTDKKIDEYTNDAGKRVLTLERADGTRYDSVGGKVFQKPEQEAGKLAADIEAQVGPKPTTAQFDGKAYPSVQAAQAAWGKAAEKIGNEKAAAGANARGAAYGANRPTNVLDTWNGNRPVVVSAKDAEENPQRYVTQSGGTAAVGKQVTADDIEGALNNLKAVTRVLDGGILHRSEVAGVLADPKSTAAKFMQSPVAGNLTPEEQDYVIALLTAREVVPGLRGLMPTGQATDTRVANMLATLPGPQTPSSVYANKQIDSALATLKRVRPGILNVKPGGQGGGEGGFTRPKPNVVVEQ